MKKTISLAAWHIGGCCALMLLLAARPAEASDSPLADAAKSRDYSAVQALLNAHVDVNAPRPDGATALHWAAHWNEFETAKLLLSAGARANATDDYGVTPLLLACQNGSPEMVDLLLLAEADPNLALPTGETPLMTAARTGSNAVVQALLKAGAKIDAVEDSAGQTALMWAAAESHPDVVQTLIAGGAEVSGRSWEGYTPLLFAARDGDLNTVRALLDAGADVNEESDAGMTALAVATIRGLTDFATFLLEQGADPNTGPGFTPLHWVVGRWDVGTRNADEERLATETNEWTPFDGFKGDAKIAFAKVLLDHGADVNARAGRMPSYSGGRNPSSAYGGTTQGATPFMFAAMAGDVRTMQLLLDRGADPLLTSTDGTTALMLATGLLNGRIGDSSVDEADALAATKLCVESGIDVNARNSTGDTALHGAAWRGKVGAMTIAKYLLDQGADLNARDEHKWTALTIAEGLFNNNSNTKSEDLEALFRGLGAEPSPPDLDRDIDSLVEVANSVVLPPGRRDEPGR